MTNGDGKTPQNLLNSRIHCTESKTFVFIYFSTKNIAVFLHPKKIFLVSLLRKSLKIPFSSSQADDCSREENWLL